MKRLTIHLKTTDSKYNTLAHIVKNDQQANALLAKHGENVKKHYFSFLNK
jgi:hypothetical protein